MSARKARMILITELLPHIPRRGVVSNEVGCLLARPNLKAGSSGAATHTSAYLFKRLLAGPRFVAGRALAHGRRHRLRPALLARLKWEASGTPATIIGQPAAGERPLVQRPTREHEDC